MFLSNLDTKLEYILNFLIQVTILIEEIVQTFINPCLKCQLFSTELDEHFFQNNRSVNM